MYLQLSERKILFTAVQDLGKKKGQTVCDYVRQALILKFKNYLWVKKNKSFSYFFSSFFLLYMNLHFIFFFSDED